MYRVTGTVVKIDKRSGSKAQADGEQRPWTMFTVRVLVKQMSVVEVVAFAGDDFLAPGVGDEIDWAVEVRADRRGIQANYDGAWSSV